MKNNKPYSYSAESIQVLEGLEPVRKRPGMYIGTTDEKGLHHLANELIDNALDELMNQHGNQLIICIKKDNSLVVEDNGRGIPIDIHKEKKVPAVELIFTELHAGGKFNSNSYSYSGGLHGVGASVVNALSKWLKVNVFLNKKNYYISFRDGGILDESLKILEPTLKKGTCVHFLPDENYFSVPIEWNVEWFMDLLEEKAFLIPKCKFILIDEKTNFEKTYYSETGLKNYIQEKNKEIPINVEPIFFESNNFSEDMKLKVSLAFIEQEEEKVVSFVNSIKTSLGGTHEVGVKNGLQKAIFEYLKVIGKFKSDYSYEDIKKGLFLVIELKIKEQLIQFDSQTKSKLSSASAKNFCETFLSQQFLIFLKANKLVAEKIISIIFKNYHKRKELENFKLLVKKEKNLNNSFFIGKLSPARSKNPAEKELFIVEGDSAGGSAKQGRQNFFQAILPLKGKPLNTYKTKLSDLLNNEEIKTIIHSIGTGVGQNFEIKNLNYHKIILMTDADDDGSHIQILLLTFFYKYMKPLFENQHIYLAQPPLYRLKTAKTEKYFYLKEELEEYKKTLKEKYEIQRYKGLGEMNATQLWETTMNPINRKLICVNLSDVDNLNEETLSTLMGDDVTLRKTWIEKNINFKLENE